MSTPDPVDRPSPTRPRVLLVEDNDAASKGLAKLLAAMGFEVAIVPDGVSALDALRAGPPPDFVLTDMRLPDLDGREVARSARELVPATRVALITGWDLDPTAVDTAAWGIDWVFTKPLDVHDLVAKLREASPGPRDAGPSTGGVPGTPGARVVRDGASEA